MPPTSASHTSESPASATDPESALPSVGARVAAFVAVLLGGAAGGLIGAAFARLGNFGGAAGGVVLLISALLGAGGVAVVAVLTLRAFGEWESTRRRQALHESLGTQSLRTQSLGTQSLGTQSPTTPK